MPGAAWLTINRSFPVSLPLALSHVHAPWSVTGRLRTCPRHSWDENTPEHSKEVELTFCSWKWPRRVRKCCGHDWMVDGWSPAHLSRLGARSNQVPKRLLTDRDQ